MFVSEWELGITDSNQHSRCYVEKCTASVNFTYFHHRITSTFQIHLTKSNWEQRPSECNAERGVSMPPMDINRDFKELKA